MCLAVVALDAHPAYSLVIAANRDEYHDRPAAPAAWGDAPPFADILAGRDLKAGGTWLGVRRDGRWALVTNVREGGRNDPTARSRGDLVPRVLNAGDAPAATVAGIAGAQDGYNGYNLLAGDVADAHWASNRGSGARRLGVGVHGLSNALLDTPWPKLVRTLRAVRAWAARADADTAALFAALGDRARAADAELPDTGVTRDWERLLSSPFIVGDRYGTRCSTVLTVDRAGRAVFRERTFDAAGTPAAETVETFAVR
ncbi:MAG: NRDE family protein [Betaproteobacteria bacterium]|nr:NRDE family protein [Betaproteobacteria bacterium]